MIRRVLIYIIHGALFYVVLWSFFTLLRLVFAPITVNYVINGMVSTVVTGAAMGTLMGIYLGAKEGLIRSPKQGVLLGAVFCSAEGVIFRVLASFVLRPSFDEEFFVKYASRPQMLVLTIAIAVCINALLCTTMGAVGGGLLAWAGRRRNK